MKRPGQLVLFPFPQTSQTRGSLRPALLIAKAPGRFDDWLVCMLSTQLQHCITDFDEVIQITDADFSSSGLRQSSLIRVGRLAVVDGGLLPGSIGEISAERLKRIRANLAGWLTS
jgi:mRNA interferase MazF